MLFRWKFTLMCIHLVYLEDTETKELNPGKETKSQALIALSDLKGSFVAFGNCNQRCLGHRSQSPDYTCWKLP